MSALGIEDIGVYIPATRTDNIDVIIVATRNSDIRMPHGAAYVHGKLGLKPGCATFDTSLGCSGFVYASPSSSPAGSRSARSVRRPKKSDSLMKSSR